MNAIGVVSQERGPQVKLFAILRPITGIPGSSAGKPAASGSLREFAGFR